MNRALAILSPFWALTNTMARSVLRKNAERFPVPVISVGNIVAGGAGKTEVVAAIAQYLKKKNKKVVIAMRGYGSSWSKKGGISNRFEEAQTLNFPDEALVLLKKIPGVAVAVGKDRSKVLKEHWEDLKPDVVILDDGFQHFKISRDLDILVHDFSVAWPLLRDLPSALIRVPLRISFSEVPARWKNWPWIRVQYAATQTLPKQACAFCGIGNPIRFRRFLKSKKVDVLSFKKYPDHHTYTAKDVMDIIQWHQKKMKSKPNAALLTTMKDYVKLSSFTESNGGMPGFEPMPVEIELQFLDNETMLWKKIDECVA